MSRWSSGTPAMYCRDTPAVAIRSDLYAKVFKNGEMRLASDCVSDKVVDTIWRWKRVRAQDTHHTIHPIASLGPVEPPPESGTDLRH
jgi:hypothetical protein